MIDQIPYDELARAASMLPDPNKGRHRGPCRVGCKDVEGRPVLLEYIRIDSWPFGKQWACMGIVPPPATLSGG